MKIAAVLGVKDEVELIGASIAHLRRIGVDRIAVADYGSTDGTLDVIAADQRMGDVSLTHVDPTVIVDYEAQSAQDVALARRTGADWVIVLDADEFWIPRTGSLRDCRSLHDADVLIGERYNVAITAGPLDLPGALSPANYSTLQLLTRRVSGFKAFLEARPEEPFITIRPADKPMARVGMIDAITPGGHDVVTGQPAARRVVAGDLLVAHVAFSTLARFERKVANIRAELARHPAFFTGDFAWHWRRWAEMTPEALEAEFARQVADASTLKTWRREGFLQTAAEVLGAPPVIDVERAPTRNTPWWSALPRRWVAEWTSADHVVAHARR